MRKEHGKLVVLVIAIAVIGAMAGTLFRSVEPREDTATAAETPTPPEHRGQAQTAPDGITRPVHPATVDPEAGFTHFRVGQRNVKAILPDGKLVWVGTSAGVIRYDTESDDYELLDTRTGLLANGVFHLGKLRDRLAVGTYGGGLALLDDDLQGWRIYNIPDGLGDSFVYDALELENGDIWIATWSGANRVRGGELDRREDWDLFTVANTDGALPNDWVYALEAGKHGEVWLATEGGLARFADGRWDNWTHEDGLGAAYDIVREQIEFDLDPGQYSQHHAKQKVEMGLEAVDVAYNPNYIVALEVDDDGVVWCGTWGGGLSSFDGRNWRSYTVADGLPGNHVFMLHVDPAGTLWVGTNNGLARLDGEAFRRYTTADGLFSNRVFSMATAADNSQWIGSFGGVARIWRLQ